MAYADVLRLAHEQNPETIEGWIKAYLAGPSGHRGRRLLLLPALREMEGNLAGKEDKDSKEKLRQVRRLLTDIWLF